MTSKNQVTLTFAGDSKSLERTFEKVGAGARDLGADLDRAEGDAKGFGKAIDNVAESAGRSESKFMGTADVLDGLAGSLGLNLGASTDLARSFGDLSGGLSALGPTLKTFGMSVSGMLGPIGLVAAAIGGLALASEDFREILGGVFGTITTVAGAFFGFLGGGTDEAAEDVEDMEQRQKEALEKAKADWEEYRGGVESSLEQLASPLEVYEADAEITMQSIMDTLNENLLFVDGWSEDLRTIAARGYASLSEELLKQGPIAAQAVHQFAAATDTELSAAEALFGQSGERSGTAFAEGLMRTLQVPESPAFQPVSAGMQATLLRMGPGSGGMAPPAPPPTAPTAGVKVYIDGKEIHQSLLRLQRTSGPLGLN